VLTRLEHRFPPFAGARRIDSYAALYDVTPDWYPFIGPRRGLALLDVQQRATQILLVPLQLRHHRREPGLVVPAYPVAYGIRSPVGGLIETHQPLLDEITRLEADFSKDPATGPDSYVGYLVSTFQGSTETTFYVLAVYFGAVGIRRIRHALAAALTADIAGIAAAVFIVSLLYGG